MWTEVLQRLGLALMGPQQQWQQLLQQDRRHCRGAVSLRRLAKLPLIGSGVYAVPSTPQQQHTRDLRAGIIIWYRWQAPAARHRRARAALHRRQRRLHRVETL